MPLSGYNESNDSGGLRAYRAAEGCAGQGPLSAAVRVNEMRMSEAERRFILSLHSHGPLGETVPALLAKPLWRTPSLCSPSDHLLVPLPE